MNFIRNFFLSVVIGMLAVPGSLGGPQSRPHPETLQIVTSYYGEPFHGRLTASGKRFDKNNPRMAAHLAWPFKTRLKLTNPENGRTQIVEITDRGPYINKRGLDVSQACARKLGFEQKGVTMLEVTFLDDTP